MLQKIFTKPVELKVDGKIITFTSLDDFEFSLAARTTIPLEKINEALTATTGELDLELNAITVAIEQLSELKDLPVKKGEITQSLKGINPVIFSNDHGWREIFFALKKDQSADSSQYKQIALNAYLKYLTNRYEMIEMVKAQLEDSNIDSSGEAPNFRTGELDIVEKLDFGILAKELGMTALPKAESVNFELNEDEEIALLLANYKCKLVYKDEITFVDHDGKEYVMAIGMNKIGRSSECKVRFVDSMHRISRTHLLIINNDNGQLELTDLSTYGTYYLQKSP